MAKKLSTFTIAAVYVGTVVGAGFASGQEVLQFFGYFGLWGLVGIAVATAIFIFYGIAIMDLGNRLEAKSFLPVIRETGGKWASVLMDIVITFFLFGIVVTMDAGSGAIFVEQFGRPALLGSFIMAAATLVTVLLGLNRVIESISFVAPVLLASVIALSLWTVFSDPGALAGNLGFSNTEAAAVPFWPAAAVLYGSYNLILAVPILAPLGALTGRENLRRGAALGGLGLGIGVLAIAAAILARAPQVTKLEVPMIAVAGGISPFARTAYSVVLLAEVYTTAAASLYGFGSRLAEPDSKRYKWLSAGASAVALALAQFGFSNLVGTLFPAVGFAGLLLLAALTYGYLKPALENFRGIFPVPAAKLFKGKAGKKNSPEASKNGKNRKSRK